MVAVFNFSFSSRVFFTNLVLGSRQLNRAVVETNARQRSIKI